ncbi:MAG: discoidin domain-containing protein [Blautia sp.]|nr:discoidin domain-containing protein [Blautia sp.]
MKGKRVWKVLGTLLAVGLTAMCLASAVGAEEAANGRNVQTLDDGWFFFYAGEDSLDEAAGAEYEAADWESISLPHTWNALDAQDGGNDYARGYGWYRYTLPWEASMEGKSVFLKFYGASMLSDVYINGEAAAHHEGAYTAFAVEVTDLLKADGDNVIAVRCDNRKTEDVAPQGGDFSVQGGLYRRVELICTDPVHVDTLNFGSNGLFLTTTDVSAQEAVLTVRSDLVNETDAEQTVTVHAVLANPDFFEELDVVEKPLFDVSTMAPGGEVSAADQTVTIPAGEAVPFEAELKVDNPRLWNGKADPYRYEVTLSMQTEDGMADEVKDFVGFRSFTVDADKGLFLNGEPYQLHGVSRHQDVRDIGYALSLEDHERDFGILYDLGANAVRLAHYPQDPWFYELCDRYGIVVWAEIPHVGGTLNTDAFCENLKVQLQEMIRQQYNHPSIFFWGLQNEINDPEIVWILEQLNDLAHEEDPTRLTTQAIEKANAPIYPSDVLAYNIYPGWYYEGSVAEMMDAAYAIEDERPLGISEYGAGANTAQHEENAQLSIGQSRGQWHPEEFQSNWHEAALEQISGREFIWCNFIWNLFDFASDGKAEGGQYGINDKGLVTHDRQTKKDAYYLYKANWNPDDLFVHFTSQRYSPRDFEINEIKVYSNLPELSLTVNGEDYGTLENNGFGVFKWEGVPLEIGENTLTAEGADGISETIMLERVLSSNPTLSSDSEAVVIDNQNREITLNGVVTAADFLTFVKGINGTEMTLLNADGEEPAEDENVTVQMTVKTVSADGSSEIQYIFSEPNLAENAEISATSEISAHPLAFINDMDGKTYWSSDRGATATIDIDLGQEYNLTGFMVDWLNNSMNERIYLYTIETSLDGEEYTMIVDRSANEEGVAPASSLRLEDSLENIRARYIRLDVLGGPVFWAECVEINEIKIDGYDVSSEAFKIDHDACTISMKKPDDTLSWEAFEAELTLSGTYQGITTQTGAYYVSSGDEYIIIDADGEQHSYTVLFR